MVGKPNVPCTDFDDDWMAGSSMPTPGIVAALDQEREASMADEGGTSGAVMESEDQDTRCNPTSHRPLAQGANMLVHRRDAHILAAVCIGGIVLSIVGSELWQR